jgi:hypothetical protein
MAVVHIGSFVVVLRNTPLLESVTGITVIWQGSRFRKYHQEGNVLNGLNSSYLKVRRNEESMKVGNRNRTYKNITLTKKNI